MTNNAKQRKNMDKRSRPKSWCVPSTRVDLNPAITKNINGFSKQALYHGDIYEEEKDTLNGVNHKFTYRRLSYNNNSKQTNEVIDRRNFIPHNIQGNTTNKVPSLHHDDNNNPANDKIRSTGKHPKVIRRNNVDKISRRSVVSLNFNKDYSSYVDHMVYRPKKSRPKTLYRNIFRRSCNLLKFQVFGDNSKEEYPDPVRGNNDTSNLFEEYDSILTDGGSCIFSGDTMQTNGNSYTSLVGRDASKHRSNNDVCQGKKFHLCYMNYMHHMIMHHRIFFFINLLSAAASWAPAVSSLFSLPLSLFLFSFLIIASFLFYIRRKQLINVIKHLHVNIRFAL